MSNCRTAPSTVRIRHMLAGNTWQILSKCLLTDLLIDASFVYSFFLAVLARGCCYGFPLVAESRGRSLVAALGLLIVAASLVAEHRLRVCERQQLRRVGSAAAPRPRGPAAPVPQSTGSRVVAPGPSCTAARGYLLRPGIKPVSLALASGLFTPFPGGFLMKE
ncbi:unnamed protein product [Rangifer tarandus platyrhynchus]|uniref:Uncharacterized protein n=1 Tax=Rangifer tarandus platyrhynchus TaxID=3082113 RepID=A0AC59YL12_RANTA